MRWLKTLELEWKVLLFAILLFVALLWPVQRFMASRFEEVMALSVDAEQEKLLVTAMAKSSGEEHEAFARGLERYRQWRAMAPILEEEWRKGFLAFSLCLLLLFSGIAAITLRRLTRPLKTLAYAAESIGKGERPVIPTGGGGALGRLETSMAVMESELSGLRARAVTEGMEQAWRDIARVIAHEIKNAVTPVRLSLDKLEERLAENRPLTQEEQKRFTERLTALTEQLERLVSSFGSFARTPDVRFQHFDWKPILEQAAETHRASLQTHFEGSGLIYGDPMLFQQISLNIWKNAAEAGAANIRVIAAPLGLDLIQIRVQDDGPGLSPEKLDKAFLPYVSYKPGGSGLGLAVVKRLMESMKGRVTLSSEPGKGLCVQMDFVKAGKETQHE